MDLPRIESPPGLSGLEKAAKVGLGIARGVGVYAVNFAQRGLDIAHRAVRHDTYFDLEKTANINSVNGCYQRGKFFFKLGEMIDEKQATQLTMSFIDIVDFANSINNPFGHDTGDKALAVSGWAIRAYFSNPLDEDSVALVGSWGGDEFVCAAGGEDALNQDHPLFTDALDYYSHLKTGESRVSFNLKQFQKNMETAGSPHAIGIYPTVRELVHEGIDSIDFRFSSAIADIDGASSGRTAIDQFVRDHSKKGNARSEPRE